LTGDSEQLHSFHAVVIKNDARNFDNDLTVIVSKNVRTVTVSTAANAVTLSPSQKDGVAVQSAMSQPDCAQRASSKVLDTTALAAALPCASCVTSGSAFAGCSFATAFSKSETGQR